MKRLAQRMNLSLHRCLRFAGSLKRETYFSLLIMMAILAYVIWAFPDFRPFPEWTTWSMTRMIGALDYVVTDYQNNLIVQGFNPVAISAECSGIVIMIAFLATIQIMPGFTLFQKFTAVLFAPLIFAGNLVRVFMSLMTGIKGGVPAMIFVHDTVGQIFVFFWAIAVYFLWLYVNRMFPKDVYANKMHHRWHHRTMKK